MYQILYLAEVQKDIKAISKTVCKAIRTAIEKKITFDPYNFGKPLRYSWKGHRRLRVGNYRVIYRIVESKKEVIIVAISHRKNIYEK